MSDSLAEFMRNYLGYWCGCSWVSERSWPAGCVAALSAAVGGAPRPATPSSSLVALRPPVCPSAAPEPPPEPPSPPEPPLPAQQPPSVPPRPPLTDEPYRPPAADGLPPLLAGHHRQEEKGELKSSKVKYSWIWCIIITKLSFILNGKDEDLNFMRFTATAFW